MLESRRLSRILAAGGLVAALAVSPAAAQRPAERTMSLIARDASFHAIDNPPRQGLEAPPLAGDVFVFEQHLFTRADRRAGTFNAWCVATSGGERGRYVCTGTYALAGGTIMAQAVLVGEGAPRIAVTGGTGSYAGARGYVTSAERRDGSLETIHLLR
jgi:hypothetical protein